MCSIGPGIDAIDTTSTAEAVRKLNARKDMLSKDLGVFVDGSETVATYPKSLAGDSVPPEPAKGSFVQFTLGKRLGKGDSPAFAPNRLIIICRKEESRKDG